MASPALADVFALYHITIWMKPVEAREHIRRQQGREHCGGAFGRMCGFPLSKKWGRFKKRGHSGPKRRLEFQRNIVVRTEGYHGALTAHPSLSGSAHSGCKKMIPPPPISISEPGLNEVE